MAHDPYASLPPVPDLAVTSEDVQDGERLPEAHVIGGPGPDSPGLSPQLSWSGAPAETRSYVVTMYDPDAPTVSGFWHWVVANIPADVTSLPTDAGRVDGSGIPDGAIQLRNDRGVPGYLGAGPPPGHGPHRYFLVVHAVSEPRLDVTEDSTPAQLSFQLFTKTLARGRMVMTYER